MTMLDEAPECQVTRMVCWHDLDMLSSRLKSHCFKQGPQCFKKFAGEDQALSQRIADSIINQDGWQWVLPVIEVKTLPGMC